MNSYFVVKNTGFFVMYVKKIISYRRKRFLLTCQMSEAWIYKAEKTAQQSAHLVDGTVRISP